MFAGTYGVLKYLLICMALLFAQYSRVFVLNNIKPHMSAGRKELLSKRALIHMTVFLPMLVLVFSSSGSGYNPSTPQVRVPITATKNKLIA